MTDKLDTNAKHLPTKDELKAYNRGLRDGRIAERREILEWIEDYREELAGMEKSAVSALYKSLRAKLEAK